MINLGLARISLLASHLSKPTWKAVHIAGTNGKGSVAAYLSSLFLRLSQPKTSTNELKIGRFTSPHLVDRWDCITVNDKPVSEALFLAVEEQVRSAATRIQGQLDNDNDNDTKGEVTEFELLTATAFEIFSQQKCQVAVVECGLGGRLDATNVLAADTVAVSVMTKIGLDHQGLLGNTVDDIAREKAGIIKTATPAVVDGTNDQSVRTTIAQVANAAGAQVLYTTLNDEHFNVDLPVHQKQNLAVALLAFQTAAAHVPDLTIQAAQQSILPQIISDVARSYPGRLQHLSITPIVPGYQAQILLDGAHNPQSATILRQYIDDMPTKVKSVHWILAVSQGKNAAEIFQVLLRPDDTVVFCGFGKVDGMPWVRSTDTSELINLARPLARRVHGCDDIAQALEYSCADQESADDLVVVAGSLYLVSDLLRLLRTKS